MCIVRAYNTSPVIVYMYSTRTKPTPSPIPILGFAIPIPVRGSNVLSNKGKSDQDPISDIRGHAKDSYLLCFTLGYFIPKHLHWYVVLCHLGRAVVWACPVIINAFPV